MTLYDDEDSNLSLGLVEFLAKSAREYCKKKGLPEEVLPELLGDRELGRFARGLNLKVEIKSCPIPRPEGLDIALKTSSQQEEIPIVI